MMTVNSSDMVKVNMAAMAAHVRQMMGAGATKAQPSAPKKQQRKGRK